MSKTKVELIENAITCSIGEKDMLTVEEAMAYASVGRDTLKEWRDGGLAYRTYGRRIWFLKKDILEFMLGFEVIGKSNRSSRRVNHEKNKRLLG